MAFSAPMMTNKGIALQAKAQAGAQLNYTRMAIGDGSLAGGQSIPNLVALISEKKSLLITKLKTLPGGKAVIGMIFSNEDIMTGFNLREIGVFAQDPDEGEILYCYTNAGAGAEFIAPSNGTNIVEKNIEIIAAVGNASNVTATIDDTLVMVTQKYLDDRLAVIEDDKSVAPIPIHSGTQTLQGGSSPAIAFPRVTGRTLINQIGDAGACETAAGWTASAATISQDTVAKVSGSNSLKATITSSGGGMFRSIFLKGGSYYVAIGHLKNGNATKVNLRIAAGPVTSNDVTDTTKFSPAILKITKAADTAATLDLTVTGTNGQYANIDAVRLLEVTQAEYNALDTMTADEIAAKYPYVGTGIYGVKNATVEVVQDNMAPPFGEWGGFLNTKYQTIGPYTNVIMPGTNAAVQVDVKAEPNTTYTLSVDSMTAGGGIGVNTITSDGNFIDAFGGFTSSLSKTFTTSANTAVIRIIVSNAFSAPGNVTFTNPMLVPGAAAAPFKPQKKTKSIINTELLSNLNGTLFDEFRYVNGKPTKFKKFEKIILDGSLNWQLSTSFPGFRRVAVSLAGVVNSVNNYATKYDGKPLTNASTTLAADNFGYDDISLYYFSIASADSGWGDSYSPTVADIQAYFNGWVMYEGAGVTTSAQALAAPPYNLGTQRWRNRSGGAFNFTTVPTTQTGEGVYQLQYQMAGPPVEEIAVGGLAIIEPGDNYVTLSSTGAPAVSADIAFADSMITALEDANRTVSGLTKAQGVIIGSLVSDQPIPNTAVYTRIPLSCDVDRLGEFMGVAAGHWAKIRQDGVYLISANITANNVQDAQKMGIRVYVNGGSIQLNIGGVSPGVTSDNSITVAAALQFSAGDVVDLYAVLVGGSAGTTLLKQFTWVTMTKIA